MDNNIEKNVPKHLAIILDGNGRWAKKRHMPRNYGHSRGSQNVEEMCTVIWNKGIKYFTVYAFSTENWKRPKEEVDKLMELFGKYLIKCKQTCKTNNMKLRVIGDRSGLSEELQRSIEDVESFSSTNTGLNFTIAINYGGRDELTRAFKAMSADIEAGKINTEDIKEELISSYLDTKELPDPDLLIRTSGECRLSNFLLWQIAYSEFYFSEKLWPDFDKEELEHILDVYSKRERRFGGTK